MENRMEILKKIDQEINIQSNIKIQFKKVKIKPTRKKLQCFSVTKQRDSFASNV